MLSLFHLNVDDEEKQNFLLRQISNAEALPLFHLAKNDAAVLEKVQQIREAYAFGDSPEDLIDLHKELKGLCKKWTVPSPVSEIEKKLSKMTDTVMKACNVARSVSRSLHPITSLLINKTSDLFDTVRQVLEWTSEQNAYPRPSFRSLNNPVYQISTKGRSVGFFKQGFPRTNSGVLEELAWQIAGILGVEEFFCPTKYCEIPLGGPHNPSLEGTLQPTIHGETLRNLDSTQCTFEKSKVTRVGLIGILLGMPDLHTNNYLTEEKSIFYFDNTRFLAENGYLHYGSTILMTGLSSGLLFLPQAHEDFSLEEREEIKRQIEFFKSRLRPLATFLRSKTIKERLLSLPPGWMLVPSAFAALKERLAAMEQAIDHPRANNLVNFFFLISPEARFFCALYFVSCFQSLTIGLSKSVLIHQERLQKFLLRTAFNGRNRDIIELLDAVYNKIDIKALRTLCYNPCTTFHDDILHIWEVLEQKRPRDPFQALSDLNELKNDLINQATVDLKDVGFDSLFDAAQFEHFGYMPRAKDKTTWLPNLNPGEFAFCEDSKNEFTLYIRSNFGGILKVQCDLLSFPGCVTFRHPSMLSQVTNYEDFKETVLRLVKELSLFPGTS